MDVRKIRIEDYDYPLPEERIAQHPLARRDSCKLLVAGMEGNVSHRIFSDLPVLLRPGTLVVANETKVIRARMEFMKASGARIEIFLLEPLRPNDYVTNFVSTKECEWACLVGNKKRWKGGTLLQPLKMPGCENVVELSAEIVGESEGNEVKVKFSWTDSSFSFAEILETAGNIPIPPYLKRKSEESDTTDYQTVYSRTEGSVAAPTAGLHFTPELIEKLKEKGDEFATVTLHVGAGTFQPVKSEEIGGHPMHTEWFAISRRTLQQTVEALENGRDILAVGTTTVRTLESLPYLGMNLLSDNRRMEVTQWQPYEAAPEEIDTLHSLRKILEYMREEKLDFIEANTSIMIAPGFRWRIVNKLITNFHQPKSTLLLLVSSFLGRNGDRERWRGIYDEALKEGYRFLSYGDACLFTRGRQSVMLPLAKSMVIRSATIKAVENPEIPVSENMFGQGCDDSYNYLRALRAVQISRREKDVSPRPVYIGEGAAPLRFLTAYAASLEGVHVDLTCAEGLQKRPILPLISTLQSLGAEIEFHDIPDWHIRIKGRKLKGGAVEVDSSFTSQYLSALMLASPLWEDGLRLENEGAVIVSKPYVRMTERMMADPKIQPEPDWSAAAFFYEYCLISGIRVEISRLVPAASSLQGDAACCDIYGEMGVNTTFHHDGSATLSFDREAFERLRESDGFEFDFNSFPDMVPSVAVALCYRKVPFRLRGIGHLRYKECDRLSALWRLLSGLGYEISVEDDTLVFNGEFRPMEDFPVEIEPYGDHRMAMAFYPLELLGMVIVEDKDVVGKSFPNFYQQFK